MSEAGAGDTAAWEEAVHGVRVRRVASVGPSVGPSAAEAGAQWDALVLVTGPGLEPPRELAEFVAEAHRLDKGLDKSCGVAACAAAWGARLVLAPAGPLSPYHDVRSIAEATLAGVQRAMAAGSRRPVLALQPHPRWPRAPLVALLAALEALYVPLQIRESFPAQAHCVQALGVVGASPALLRDAMALEHARALARDVGGADPERMAPRAAADLVRAALCPPAPAHTPAHTPAPPAPAHPVRVRVLDDADVIRREYPLFAAVSRAADCVPRHRGCIVFLEYSPDEYDETVMLVGKGVTYDTGGCDIKAGGAMAGMSRDKCGAAAVAGFFKACALLRPRVRALGALALVRNSVGSEAYVADELVRCRRGLAVRVANTDAEGRMVMADLLHEMCERAASERSPVLYTVATLTGHAHRAFGAGYSAALDNHVARERGHARSLQAAGDALGDMIEISTIRREDLAAHEGRWPGDHVHQADNAPSTQLPRGHQGPAGFLLLTSGLHEAALAYCHLDVAASAGAPPAPPSAAPLLALAARHGLLASC